MLHQKEAATGSGPAATVEMGAKPRTSPPNVLMIHPKFAGGSFWGFGATVELYGAKYPLPPLGLATVAALLPSDWTIRILDQNAEEVTDADIDAADLIMTGGMLPQRTDLLKIIDRAQARGKPVCVGGPDIMSSSHVFAHADFMVVGEAEGILDQFVEAWQAGAVRGRFDAERFKSDVTASPIPRFDLLNFPDYAQMSVQYSRGCPFTCEFCDIIELFGRRPRTKSTPQILAELDAIKDLGYRGHVNFVDDNLIGNKKAVKAFLPHLIQWQKDNGFPFDFSTEASLNMADDEELMRMLAEAGFIGVFIGIESPDEDVLNATKKKQNTRRDISESIHKVYEYGLGVMGGFIVGFDEETGNVGDAIADLIDDAAIPMAMVGLLYALPETELTRRLDKEGRLHGVTFDNVDKEGSADQCTQGLNFDTIRPRADILRDFRTVVARSYHVDAYHARVRRAASLMKFDHSPTDLFRSGLIKNLAFVMRLMWKRGIRDAEGKRQFWGTLLFTLRKDPGAFESVFLSLAAWAHLGPFSKVVLAAIDKKIEDLEVAERAPAPIAAE